VLIATNVHDLQTAPVRSSINGGITVLHRGESSLNNWSRPEASRVGTVNLQEVPASSSNSRHTHDRKRRVKPRSQSQRRRALCRQTKLLGDVNTGAIGHGEPERRATHGSSGTVRVFSWLLQTAGSNRRFHPQPCRWDLQRPQRSESAYWATAWLTQSGGSNTSPIFQPLDSFLARRPANRRTISAGTLKRRGE